MTGQLVFENLRFHAYPNESALFASDRILRLSLDTLDDQRVTLVFTGVVGVRCEDSQLLEMEKRLPNPPAYDALFRVVDSDWLIILRASYEQDGHHLSPDTAHYALCSEDYTWEILARRCELEPANC